MRYQLQLTVLLACLGVAAAHAETIPADKGALSDDGSTTYYDIRLLGVEGQGWSGGTKAPYDRLPARAEDVVRDAVWNLSRNSAGMAVRFVTDATTLKAKWSLTSGRLAMDHMPATGVSGLDLYVRDKRQQWRWLSVGRPKAQTNDVTLIGGIPAGDHEFLIYLPLYNGVTSVEIGIPTDSRLSSAPDYTEKRMKPIVFYGTSITHGACASRPGMTHSAILGRRFGREIVNLGFSGNGRMEIEVARFMAEIDASVYVIDCLPNIQAKEVRERTGPLVRLLREKRPETPILLVEDRNYSDSFLIASKRRRNAASQASLKEAYRNLQEAGCEHLYYLEGKGLLGDDNEGTVDSSHPTDLGFWRQADAFEKVLRKIPGL